jgi:hypothetical protein
VEGWRNDDRCDKIRGRNNSGNQTFDWVRNGWLRSSKVDTLTLAEAAPGLLEFVKPETVHKTFVDADARVAAEDKLSNKTPELDSDEVDLLTSNEADTWAFDGSIFMQDACGVVSEKGSSELLCNAKKRRPDTEIALNLALVIGANEINNVTFPLGASGAVK